MITITLSTQSSHSSSILRVLEILVTVSPIWGVRESIIGQFSLSSGPARFSLNASCFVPTQLASVVEEVLSILQCYSVVDAAQYPEQCGNHGLVALFRARSYQRILGQTVSTLLFASL